MGGRLHWDQIAGWINTMPLQERINSRKPCCKTLTETSPCIKKNVPTKCKLLSNRTRNNIAWSKLLSMDMLHETLTAIIDKDCPLAAYSLADQRQSLC
jgi:hypothetical protein